MYIYKGFLESLVKGKINVFSDYIEAILIPDQSKYKDSNYVPKIDDTYEDILVWEDPNIPHHQARLDAFYDENDLSLKIILSDDIIWSDITADIRAVVFRRVNNPDDSILLGFFELKKVKHLDNADFRLVRSYDSHLFKFK